MTDARIVRTRASLHRAIIELATSKRVTAITVSELANEAGINRVTFYKHYATPSDALGSALKLEYDPARDRFLQLQDDGVYDAKTIFKMMVDDILDHIDSRRDLYELSIDTPSDGTVPNLIADHLTEALMQYLEKRAGEEPPLPESVDLELTARFLSHGLVGAIKGWVISGDHDHQQFINSLGDFIPDWFYSNKRGKY